MSARPIRAAAFAALLLAASAAFADAWDAGEVEQAEKLRADEAARAAEYRERVARGDVRGPSAPMPREAPQTPRRSAGDSLRGAADIVDLIERWLRAGEGGGTRREELRRRERGRARTGSPP